MTRYTVVTDYNDWQVLPASDRHWVWRDERHVTYRRARRGPHRGRVQALVEDSYRRKGKGRKRP